MKTVILLLLALTGFSASAAVVDHATWVFGGEKENCDALQTETQNRMNAILTSHRVNLNAASVTTQFVPAHTEWFMVVADRADVDSQPAQISESAMLERIDHDHLDRPRPHLVPSACTLAVKLNHPQWGIEGHSMSSHSGDGMSQLCANDYNSIMALPQTIVAQNNVSGVIGRKCVVVYLQVAPKN